MSVEVAYPGRFGNNLFQYIFARLFARRNGLKLVTDFNHNHIVSMATPPHGFEASGPLTEIGEGEWSLEKKWPAGRYLVKGYFQRASIYYDNREEILGFAHPVSQPCEQPSDDLVVNFRIDGDYRQHLAIHPSWYREVLRTESYRRLFVVADVNDPAYFKEALGGRKYELVGGSPKVQWDFLRGFERVIMSNSTFCWWAVFFGRAKKAVIFKRWIGSDNVVLGRFPGAVEIDGPFLFENPIDWSLRKDVPAEEPFVPMAQTSKKVIVFPASLKVADVLADLRTESPPFAVVNVGSDASKTYVYLQDEEKRDPIPRLKRLASLGAKRNLCFYIYPKNPFGWRWHVERIQELWRVFNGKKIVIIATDAQTEPAETVMRAFSDRSIKFLCVPNHPTLWETKHFIGAISLLCSVDPKEFTFYAHAKGVIHNEDQLKRVRRWCAAMYSVNLERPDLIDKLLSRYGAVGCFKHSFSIHDWFFAGTFFWFKHSSVFSKNWRDIGEDRYAVEKYLCRHIPTEEAKALTPFLGGGDLYGNPPQESIYKGWLQEHLLSEALL